MLQLTMPFKTILELEGSWFGTQNTKVRRCLMLGSKVLVQILLSLEILLACTASFNLCFSWGFLPFQTAPTNVAPGSAFPASFKTANTALKDSIDLFDGRFEFQEISLSLFL